ncbi:NUDIX family hydrolase [Nitzschia inconspicua]|uniref:NUDIX family hydrolase n=1 Tax=Nitzschia inconspicua TaxID=303405 RepID=A0A9K3LHP2_9STRA|nr:NUDIX family hydrolase [Nitzschia inconspicua]
MVSSRTTNDSTSLTFPRRLPASRLGTKHDTLDAFHHAVHPFRPETCKEYTLVVVTERVLETNSSNGESVTRQRILLGLKNRGFGMGMYNSFGGKFLHDEESVEECACRELREETNLIVTLEEMTQAKVGIQRYTFQNDPVEMVMHVFRIQLESTKHRATHTVMGCDEITPQWFEDINQIPFDNMFADDSLWLTALLSSEVPLAINGSYHFRENCQETNTILEYHMNVQPKNKNNKGFSLEQRLFHALHNKRVHSPNIKEFKENYAFCNAVRNAFGKSNSKHQFDIVIDVAGGHGALGALFLVCTSAYEAVVVDPADVGGAGVWKAWGTDFIGCDKRLRYRSECLRTGLPAELENALTVTSSDRILVVACHACQHLSEETMSISCQYGVHVAVMPCCQTDLSTGGSWKSTSRNLSVPVAVVMDLLQCGKIMALGTYDVRMKVIDPDITPQNRIISCRALHTDATGISLERKQKVARAHSRLANAYKKAHVLAKSSDPHYQFLATLESNFRGPALYLSLGFAMGVLSFHLVKKR